MRKLLFLILLSITLTSCEEVWCGQEHVYGHLVPPIKVIKKDPWIQSRSEGSVTVIDANGRTEEFIKHASQNSLGDIIHRNFQVGDIVDLSKVK